MICRTSKSGGRYIVDEKDLEPEESKRFWRKVLGHGPEDGTKTPEGNSTQDKRVCL
jgi:hypothetical protein